jgi:uncharacterized protein (TIGR03083 family)
MKVDEHLDGLRSAGQRLADAAAEAGLDAAVPSCPDWVVRDLVRHQGGVHRWAMGHLTGPRTELWHVELDEVVGEWPADADLLGWFADGHAALIAALADADPDLNCAALFPGPPRAVWARRQAHETTVHGVDAELATGRKPVPVPAPLAADGIDELLTCFITRRGGRLRADRVTRLRVSCTDHPASWLVSIEPDQVVTTPDGTGDADCQLSGPASDVYLALWNRGSDEGLAVDGDQSVLALFADRVRVRWS